MISICHPLKKQSHLSQLTDLTTKSRIRPLIALRSLKKLVMTDATINKHPSTKYAASLISVRDADLTASPQIVALRKGGEVYEGSSSVKP